MADLSKVMEREMLHSEHAARCYLEAKRRDRRPHDAGSHDQPMTPAVQRVIDEADKRARDKAAMPPACPTPTGCREHGCHGDCLPPNVRGNAGHARKEQR